MTISDKKRYFLKLLVNTKKLGMPLLNDPNCNSQGNIKEVLSTCVRLTNKGVEPNDLKTKVK